MTPRRIQEFDGLRALAVLVVIFDHYAPFRTFGNGAPAKYGGIGVDVFFVLSGFLITGILLGMKAVQKRYQVFYARRALRIVPPFVLLLTFVYSIGMARHEPLDKSKLAGQLLFLRSFKGTPEMIHGAWSIASGKAPAPGLFDKVTDQPVEKDYPRLAMSGSLGPTWSLSVEEWFYVLWAPVVLLLPRRVVAVVALLSCGFGFLLRWSGAPGINLFANLDILMVGGVLALWIEKRLSLQQTKRTLFDRCIAFSSLAAFAAFVVLACLDRTLISRTLIEVFVFGAMAWIITNAGSRAHVCRVLRLKSLGYFGTISYMVYLIHLPMYFVCRSLLQPRLSGVADQKQAWIIALVGIGGTVVLSAISWRYYEEPILRLKSRITRAIESRGSSPVRTGHQGGSRQWVRKGSSKAVTANENA